jgi:transposase
MAKAPADPEPPVVDDGYRLPDALWTRIVELLPRRPVHPLGCHRPRVDDRRAMDAIFFVLRTGCQWNALSATGICSSSSAHRRFQEWAQAGVFRELWRLGLIEYDGLKGIDWSWQAMDGAMTKAPLGGEKDGQEPDRPRQAGRQAERLDRGRRGADRHGGGGGQPQRLQDGAGDDREHPDRAA